MCVLMRRQEALAYFRRIRELGSYPPRFLCSLLVQLLICEDMPDEAEAVFKEIVERGIEPTEACATEIIRLRVQVKSDIMLKSLADGGGDDGDDCNSGMILFSPHTGDFM